jgi:hypothetical protein
MDEDGSNRINITNTEDLDEWQLWRHLLSSGAKPQAASRG